MMKTSIFKKMAIAFAAFAAFAGSASAYTEGDIVGTTGTGNKNDPVQVNTFTELKAALESTEINYVELGDVSGEDGYIQLGEEGESGFTHAIRIKGEKHLTLSGTAEFIPDPNYKAVQSFIFFDDFSASLVIDGDGTLKFSAVTSSEVAGTTNVAVANFMFYFFNYGRLTIDSGNLISAVHGFAVAHAAVIYSNSVFADIIINGGYLKAESNDGEESYAVEISNGSFKMYGGTVEKTGKKLSGADASLYLETKSAGICGGTLKSDGTVKAVKLPKTYTTLNLDNFIHGKAVNANNDEVSLEQLSISETVTIVPPEMNVSKTNGGTFSLDSTKGDVAYLSASAEDGFVFVGWVNGDNLNDTLSTDAQFEYDLTSKPKVKVAIVSLEMNVSKTNGGTFSLDSTKGDVAYLSASAEDGFVFVGWVNGDNLNDTLSTDAQFEYDLTNKPKVKVAFADINTVSIVDGIIYRVDIEIEEPSNGALVRASVLKTPGIKVTDKWYKEGNRPNTWKESTFGEADWWGYGAWLEPEDGSGLSFYTIENTNGVLQCAANVYINGKAATHYHGSSSYCYVGIDLAYEITFLDENGVQIGDVVKVGSGKVPVPPTVNVREDDEYNHYFVRWTPEIVAATGNATYQASGAASVAWTEAELVGSGTETDPYLIGNAQALRDFAAKVNSGKEPSAWAVLMADIDLNPGKTVLNGDGLLYNNGEGLETWTPIGTESNLFAGTFEGNSHAIRGLYINDKDKDYAALFGDVASTAKIQNVGVVDSYIKGKAWVGSIAGVNEGSISNVYNTGFVSGNGNYVGGVVGYNKKGSASNAYNIGSVSGTGKYVGGLIGYNSGTVSNAYNAGSVIGSSSYVGGVVGLSSGTSASVSNSYYNTDFFSESNGYGEGKTSAELAALGIDEAFKFAEGEENPWTAGSKVTGDGFVTYKFPYLTKFGEKSQPELSPAVEFAAGNASATVYGATTGAVNIPADIEVSGDITFNRVFPDLTAEDIYSTIMLPFESASKPTGVTFYTIGSISEVDGKWKVTAVVENGDIAANTPYLVKVASGTKSITFNGGTFKATEGEHSVTSGNWKFVGTYEYKAWPKNDPGIGKAYGFAGSNGNDPAIVGKFAKVGAGAYIFPMRAYLEYTAPAVLGRPAANGETRTVASLPDEIEVVIVDKDEATGEETTKVIGSLNTRTGEIKFANDRWFDLQGRYLGSKKPTQKGAYYNNGKMVIVK